MGHVGLAVRGYGYHLTVVQVAPTPVACMERRWANNGLMCEKESGRHLKVKLAGSPRYGGAGGNCGADRWWNTERRYAQTINRTPKAEASGAVVGGIRVGGNAHTCSETTANPLSAGSMGVTREGGWCCNWGPNAR